MSALNAAILCAGLLPSAPPRSRKMSTTTRLALMCAGALPLPGSCRSQARAKKYEEAAAVTTGATRYEICAKRREIIARFVEEEGPVSRMDVRLKTRVSEFTVAHDLNWLVRHGRVVAYQDGQTLFYEALK